MLVGLWNSVNRLYFSFLQKRLEEKYSLQKNRGTILMFHEVYNCHCGPRKPQTATSENNFRRLVNHIGVEHFRKPIHSYDDLFCFQAGDYAITFDDVHKSVITNAIPILRECSIPYVLFVAVEFIDKEGYISTTDLEQLKSDPLCTIGSHAVHHRKYRFYPKEFYKEIKESASKLNARMFAFPYGSLYAVSRQNIEVLRNSNLYSCSFSTISSYLTDENILERWMIPRISINDKVVDTICS